MTISYRGDLSAEDMERRRSKGFQKGKNALKGWTPVSLRSNTKFLQEIDPDPLVRDYVGLFVTLTFRDVPESAQRCNDLRVAWWKEMKALGAEICHWCMEFQVRKAPHYHQMIWFRKGAELEEMRRRAVEIWLRMTRRYGTEEVGQDVKVIGGTRDLFAYVAKHSDKKFRGSQRDAKLIPEKWYGQTKGVWGKTRNWPKCPRIEQEVSRDTAQELAKKVYQRTVDQLEGSEEPELRRAAEYARDCIEKLDWNVQESVKLICMSRWIAPDEFTKRGLRSWIYGY